MPAEGNKVSWQTIAVAACILIMAVASWAFSFVLSTIQDDIQSLTTANKEALINIQKHLNNHPDHVLRQRLVILEERLKSVDGDYMDLRALVHGHHSP